MFLLINLRDSLFCGLISLLPYYHLWFNQLIALLPGYIYQRKSVFFALLKNEVYQDDVYQYEVYQDGVYQYVIIK